MHSCFHDTRRSVIATRCEKGKLPFRSTFACAVASLDYERHRRCRSGRRRARGHPPAAKPGYEDPGRKPLRPLPDNADAGVSAGILSTLR
jgi:hypothetical protein